MYLQKYKYVKTDIYHVGVDIGCGKKLLKIAWAVTRVVIALGLLFLFVCSLHLMQPAFQLIGGEWKLKWIIINRGIWTSQTMTAQFDYKA